MGQANYAMTLAILLVVIYYSGSINILLEGIYGAKNSYYQRDGVR
jgi:hypothetical protein